MSERSLFLEALGITAPAERAAFLDRACAGDADLRRGVEGLLAANDRPGSFMHKPAGGDATAEHRPSEGPGSRVGPYKLLQEIGEGGMGVVYMAEQEQPVRRKVALKIIKPGMDSKQVVARFEAERQALGMMDHPNIARVFDAGTTESGRPYFVMELVHGVPITEYCDANKLTPRERLELFVPVCQAIQHAHMKGVIHRDVKPSNVLVTMYDDKPVPKVIDFGVAKAVEQRLTEKTLFTQYGALVGTLEYMSPEQAEMNAFGVDTRSDVYSLGVLLYELLTGTTPLERQRLRTAAFGEVVRLIKEEEPPKPSMRISTSGTLAKVAAARKTEPGKLSTLVRGELDWIVMRCLEKDRTRRYDTAVGLARDVERYLKDEAVEACPPTLGYRVRKAYRKHRTALLAGGAFAAVLLAATGVSVTFALLAVRAGGEAERRRQEADDSAARAAASARVAEANEGLAQREAANVRVEQDRIRHLLYASEMASASTAFAEGRDSRVLQVLAETTPRPGEPDLRGWEWHHLNRLYDPPTREVQFGPPPPDDGKQFVGVLVGTRSVVTRLDAAASKGWFEVYDTATGQREARIPKDGALDMPIIKTGPDQVALPLRPVLDADGRHLAVRVRETDGDGKPQWRIRLWNLATGAEVAGPPPTPALPLPAKGDNRENMGAASSDLTVGPDAQWISWGIPTGNNLGDMPKAERLLTVHRWNRADGKTTTRSFPPGPGVTTARFSRDGESVLSVPAGFLPSVDRLVCWDVTADPPKPRYSIPRPPVAKGGLPREPIPVVFNDTRSAAAAWDGKEVAVYSLADGKELWRHALENKPTPDARFGRTRDFYSLSDDGKRVVFRAQFKLTVVEQPDPAKPGPAREWVVRYRPPSDAEVVAGNSRSTRWANPLGGGGIVTGLTGFRLSPDGRTFYTGLNTETMKLGMIDLSTDPQWAGPESRPRRTVGTGTEPNTGYAIRDADGNMLYTMLRNLRRVPSLHGERWVVYSRTRPTPSRSGQPPDEQGDAERQHDAWEMHDVSGSNAARLVVSGEGEAKISPDNRWLIVTNPLLVRRTQNGTNGNLLTQSYWTTTTVYRVETGEKVSEVTAPPGMVFTDLSIEPNGHRWAAKTSPTPPADEAGPGQPLPVPIPIGLRVYDAASGRELSAADLGTSSFRLGAVPFSRDGRRVFAFSSAGRNLSRIQIVRLADGTTENSFTAPSEDGLGFFGEVPDGKLLFRTNLGSIQVWDPATGALVHRLTGITTVNLAACSADSRRLFVLQVGNPTRMHVWDLVTGRELLVLPATQYAQRDGQPAFAFADGKLRYSSTDGVRVFDGTPVPQARK